MPLLSQALSYLRKKNDLKKAFRTWNPTVEYYLYGTLLWTDVERTSSFVIKTLPSVQFDENEMCNVSVKQFVTKEISKWRFNKLYQQRDGFK